MRAKIEKTIESLEFIIVSSDCIYTQQVLFLEVVSLKEVLTELEREVDHA